MIILIAFSLRDATRNEIETCNMQYAVSDLKNAGSRLKKSARDPS